MATRVMTRREQEEEASRFSHSMKLSSHSRKKTFVSSDEEPTDADVCPVVRGNLLSVQQLLSMAITPVPRTWYESGLRWRERSYRDKWTMFGNEAEKMEVAVLRNQRALRCRVDRGALRTEAEQKAASHLRCLELRGRRSPAFSIPLRAHCVWEGMSVTLACTLQGCPPPHVTWYKDGEELTSDQPWTHSLTRASGLHSLEIRRCGPEDAGVYRVVARSVLGEASSSGTLLVNAYHGALVGSSSDVVEEVEAVFSSLFPPTWVKEGQELRLSASFSSPLLPSEAPPTWFRDGVQLSAGGRVEVMSSGGSTLLVVKNVRKEHEGVYSVRLGPAPFPGLGHAHRPGPAPGLTEHRAFVYVQDGCAVVPGGPASPLGVQGSDVNLDYVFLSWSPPSAEGASPVQGYQVERGYYGMLAGNRSSGGRPLVT